MDPVLSKDRYRLLTEHFQRCIALPRSEWPDYVARLTTDDPDLGTNLEGLLRHHPEPPGPATPPPAPAATRTRRPRRRTMVRILLIAGLLIAIIILVGQLWALDRLETSLKSEAGHHLHSALEIRVAGVRRWTTEKKRQARRILSDPELTRAFSTLADLAHEPEGLRERLLKSPAYAAAADRARQGLDETGDVGFTLLSPAGAALCSSEDARVGRRVGPSGARYLRRIILDEWIVSRPQPESELFSGTAGADLDPAMFVGGVIRNPGGQVVGLGLIHVSPDPFYRLLDSRCVEFLVFDDQGLLLNNLERTGSLRTAGLLPVSPDAGTAFRLRLLDPGADLRSDSPVAPPERRSMTRMALSGSQGANGVDTTGARDFRGEPALQAWMWVPELEIGIGAQRPEEEVLSGLAPIRTSLLLSALVFVTTGLILFVLARLDRRRRRKSGETAFGSYLISRRIGRSGTSDIFLANHAYLKRPAALKILNDLDPSLETVERFEREARLASRLGHPNTVQVFDYGEAPDGRLYLAMEYVNGLNLAQLSTLGHPLPVNRIVYLLKQIAGSLDEAHQLGLIHRDLKPSNIMVSGKEGFCDIVKVLDFGIATQVEGPGEDVDRTSSIIGTPAYIAPERLRAPQLMDPRSDIYSFGAVAFHLLTGRTVFESDGPVELVYQMLTSPRPSPSQLRGERLPVELETLVLDCLSVTPSLRPPTFRSVLERLMAIPVSERWGRDEAKVWWTIHGERVARFLQATV